MALATRLGLPSQHHHWKATFGNASPGIQLLGTNPTEESVHQTVGAMHCRIKSI
jgi:hypothetical protein